ncbi:MAG: matrixin family metalloprotease [Phycisphaerae bacterium]|nr:putative Ig domain-containing protein [Phycisphaerae bacterium]NUQ45680.1 matrixin family metalloprotease [Phycisphaerae bacterium]
MLCTKGFFLSAFLAANVFFAALHSSHNNRISAGIEADLSCDVICSHPHTDSPHDPTGADPFDDLIPVVAAATGAPPQPLAPTPLDELTARFGRPVFVREQLANQGRDPVAFCFAPGTPEDIQAYYNEVMYTDPTGARYQLGGRWSGTQGSPRALTWSFVPDGLAVDGDTSELFSRMDALFAAQGGRATWIARIQSCFDRWQALGGTSYTRITSGGNDWDDGASWGTSGGTGRGDIRIAMISIDGSSGVLAYNYFPSNGDMVLDRAENWGSSSNTHRFLRNVVLHEHGHGFGLAHVCPSNGTKLMEPIFNSSFDGPRHDDIRAQHRHYGDNWENNNGVSTAADLGPLNIPSTTTFGTVPAPSVPNSSILSIDANGEVDFFKFTIAQAANVTITVTPVGISSYDSSPQNANGSCSSGNFVDSLAHADLNVDLRSTNGTTILATANSQPAGVAEVISSVTLPGAGTYYTRVFEGNSPTQSQLYTLTIGLTATCVPPTIAGISNHGAACGSPYTSPTPSATGTTPMTWTLQSVTPPAPGMSINSGTGVVTWANPQFAPGGYTIVIQAANACGSDTEDWVLTVGSLPNISAISDHSTPCGSPYTSPTPSASGQTPMTWSLASVVPPAPGMTINSANGVVTWADPDPSGSPYLVTIQVDNACGSDTEDWLLTVLPGAAPVIDPIPDHSTPCAVSYSFTPAATGATPMTWSFASPPPAGMTIDSGTGEVDWPSPDPSGSPYLISIEASNSCGTDTEDWLLTVGQPPVIADIPDQDSGCGAAFSSVPPSVTGQAPIVWSLASVVPPAPGMTIDSGTGVISWPNPDPSGSPYTVTVAADNACGSDTYSFLLTVTGGAPVIADVPDHAALCGSTYTSPTPTAGGGSVTWSLVGTPPAGMTINSSTGVVSWPNAVASATPYTIMIEATSACGSDSETWLLTVRPGDFTGDGLVTSADLPEFVAHLLGQSTTRPCAADVNMDGQPDGQDIQAFLNSLY